MKITDYKTYVFGTPWRNLTLFVIETDEGIRGYGEARVVGKTHTVIEYLKDVKRHIIGADVFDIEELYRRFTLLDFGVSGEVAMTGLALVEMACWDCIGKKTNLPVYKLLGGKLNDKIMAYANGWYKVDRMPEQFNEAAIKVVSRGYKALKFDPFGQKNFYRLSKEEFHLTEQRVSKVREAVGENVEILIEGHAKFNVMNAVKIAEMIKKYQPLFFEEPVSEETVEELVNLRKHTNVSIATGERLYTKFPFAQIVEKNAADVLQPDIANAGGITELKKISIIAEPKHIAIAPHNTCSPVGAIAEMHLGKSIPNFEIMEYHAEFYSSHYFDVFTGFPRQKNGFVSLSDKPGLGLELNEKEIKKHPPFKSTDAKGGAFKTI